jgi:hypothetical protein
MPIKPENRKRYPSDWNEIRAAILARAENRCEGSPAFPDCRAHNGGLHPTTGSRVVLTMRISIMFRKTAGRKTYEHGVNDVI